MNYIIGKIYFFNNCHHINPNQRYVFKINDGSYNSKMNKKTCKQVKYMNFMLYVSELGKTNAFSYPSIKDISFSF